MGVTEGVLKSHRDTYNMKCSKIDKRGGQGPKTIYTLYASAQFFHLCVLVFSLYSGMVYSMSVFLNKGKSNSNESFVSY